MTTAVPPATSIRITPTASSEREVAAWAAAHGGRVGLAGVLADLSRRARPTVAPGRAVRRALTWDAVDRRDRRWWPQGITSSADAGFVPEPRTSGDRWDGRRLLVTSWYSRAGDGCRLTVLDRDLRRYQHVLLGRLVPGEDPAGGVPALEPLRAHAGGICWLGPWILVAATARGFHLAHVDDIVRMPRSGHRFVLPIRGTYAASSEPPEEPLRFSFLSVDREAGALLVGEYGRGVQTRRLARFALDPASGLPVLGDDGSARPTWLDAAGPRQAQGVVRVGGRLYLTSSDGPVRPGHVHTGDPGNPGDPGDPGALRRHRWATPVGPEDLSYWPGEDLLWSVTEHPRRRWIYAMRRTSFG